MSEKHLIDDNNHDLSTWKFGINGIFLFKEL
jgi:hypothetical protein